MLTVRFKPASPRDNIRAGSPEPNAGSKHAAWAKVFLLLVLAAAAGACDGDSPSGPEEIVSVTVAPQVDTVELGAVRMLEATARDQSGRAVDAGPPTWISSDTLILTVDAAGQVIGRKTGSATVTATIGSVSGQARVTVVPLVFRELTTGFDHTCGLTERDTAYCWGTNSAGAIGDGTSRNHRNTPVAVAEGRLRFESITAGHLFTCGMSTSGDAYCWGRNYYGQLGDGGTTDQLEPTAVTGGATFVTIGAGNGHTCALDASGAAWCWGLNESGQLGDGTTANRAEPMAVHTEMRFDRISVLGNFSCGLTNNGTAHCWGRNAVGQLGNGSTDDQPEPVPVAGGLVFRRISAGGAHACGIAPDGAAYCWGSNNTGQLGAVTTELCDYSIRCSTTPLAVSGGLAFSAIGPANMHTCGVTNDGAGYCWGWNGGAFGDGGSEHSGEPVAVSGDLRFVAIEGGLRHTCGLTTEHKAYCWGENGGGALGDGTFESRRTPTLVSLQQ